MFVDAAIALARRFHISEILIGATIVSMGTTVPETTVSALASISRLSDIAYGNALGSVICNTALVAGLLLLVSPSSIPWKEIRTSTFFFFGTGLIFFLTAFQSGGIGLLGGVLLLAMFAGYLVINMRSTSRARRITPRTEPEQQETFPLWRAVLSVIGGALMVFFGSNLSVNNGVLIAQALGVPEYIIALLFIALGTSLPEFVTAIAAVCKGHSGVSLGNIIGANLLNLTVVIGLSATISPMAIPRNLLIVDCALAAVTMLTLTLPILFTNETSRVQGLLLVALYALYCLMLLGSGIATNSTNVFAPYMFVR